MANESRKNLSSLSIDRQQWNDDGREQALHAWYAHVETVALQAIDWYFVGKTWKSRLGRWLRLASILLASVGMLMPVLAGVTWAKGTWEIDGQLGFVFLGLAGVCVAIDRFFGLTSGWIRYVMTAVQLQQALATFRLEWAKNEARTGGTKATPEFAVIQLGVVGGLLDAVQQGVIAETNAWANEFRASLDKSLRALLEEVEGARGGGAGDAGARKSTGADGS